MMLAGGAGLAFGHGGKRVGRQRKLLLVEQARQRRRGGQEA